GPFFVPVPPPAPGAAGPGNRGARGMRDVQARDARIAGAITVRTPGGHFHGNGRSAKLRSPDSVEHAMKAIGTAQPLPVSDPRSLLDLELPDPEYAAHDLLVEVQAIS